MQDHVQNLYTTVKASRWLALSSPQTVENQLVAAFQIPYRFSIYTPTDYQVNKPLSKVQGLMTHAKTVTVGDLHGSFLKLVETLVATQLVSMPLKQAKHFAKLSKQLEKALQADPYLATGQTRNDVRNLETHLQAIIPTMAWTDNNRQLILLGDVLNDRGPLDTLTLSILEHLTQGHPERIRWLASNHDYLIHHYPIVRDDQRLSSYRAYTLHPNNWETHWLPKYQWYLEQAQLMIYHPKTHALFSHAPISQEILQDLFETLRKSQGIPKKWKNLQHLTEAQLPQFMEYANTYYRTHIQTTQSLPISDREDEMIHDFVWLCHSLESERDLPLRHQGVHMLIHGHDWQTQKFSPFLMERVNPNRDYRVVNLNQNVRKFPGKVGNEPHSLYLEFS